MPHLTLPLVGGAAYIDFGVGASMPRAHALQAQGQAVPPNIRVRGLVDTGASCTCIDPSVINALGLVPTGTTPVHTPSTRGKPAVCDQYDVSLVLLHPSINFQFHALPVVESDLSAQGIHALIGQDVLRQCLLIYNGEAGTFTLAF